MSLFVVLLSLVCFSQESETYKKILVRADEVVSAETTSAGLSTSREYKSSTDDAFLEISNLNFAGGNNRPRYLQIRGQGETSTYENTPSHSVGVFIDDIDLTGISTSWPMQNVSKSEIFKGPQSTAWGGNSIGGRMQTHLTDPGAPSSVRTQYQSQKAYELGAAVDFAKRSRLFFNYNHDPGFYRNSFVETDGADRRELSMSLKNKILSTASWQIDSSHIAMQSQNGYDVWSLNRPNIDDDFETLSDQPGEDNLLLQGHALHTERKLDALNSLHSISSLTRSKSTYSYDADWGNTSYWQSIPGWNQPYDYFDEFHRQRTAWHQKLYYQNALSKAGAHLYGMDEVSDVNRYKNKAFKEGFSSQYKATSAALFADLDIPVSDKNALLWGGRYEAQTTNYSDTLLPGVERTFRFASAHLGGRHEFDSVWSARALVSQGFKSPGVNIDSALAPDERFYNPEYVTSFEVGLSAKQVSSQASATFFYLNHEDKQVKVSRQDDPMDPSSFSYFTTNAARAVSYGAEMEGLQTLGTWTFEGRVGLLKAEFRDYFFENQNLRGEDLAHAPTWNYAAGVSKNWNSRLSSTLSFIGKNDFAFSNNHDQRSLSYQLVDFGITYRKESWSLRGWVKNIFDERYSTRGFYFANEPPNWENKLYVQQGLPLHAGASLTYQF